MGNLVNQKALTLAELETLLSTSYATNELSTVFDKHYILVGMTGSDRGSDADDRSRHIEPSEMIEQVQPNCPIIALATDDIDLPPIVDLVARTDAELATLTHAIDSSPIASAMVVQLLRHNEHASVRNSLMAESLSYSCLQNSAHFKNWLKKKHKGKKPEEDVCPPLLLERQNTKLMITFNRQKKRNAYSAQLRDAFYEALVLAEEDKSIKTTLIQGAGECFSAGGDLEEFGLATDSALAHMVRMTRNTGLILDRLRSKTTFKLHGACIGAGIELPAFSNRVFAKKDSFFQLPEVAMGLVPGAGGTVSISRRIGRLRTAFMAISNQRVDAEKALEWGLIDRIIE
ncbi:MAG: enoyl-CoA hydratase [Oceanicoccus sp.]|jgi:enoyl-CoA hydratase